MAAGVAPVFRATLSALNLVKLNPARVNRDTNRAGVIVVVATICPRVWCTDQSEHNDGRAHCSSPIPVRSSARAARSAWISSQASAAINNPQTRPDRHRLVTTCSPPDGVGAGGRIDQAVGGGPASANTAESGSVTNAIRPNGVSIGSPNNIPPPAVAAATATSVSATAK